jgi:hypothetical protein
VLDDELAKAGIDRSEWKLYGVDLVASRSGNQDLVNLAAVVMPTRFADFSQFKNQDEMFKFIYQNFPSTQIAPQLGIQPVDGSHPSSAVENLGSSLAKVPSSPWYGLYEDAVTPRDEGETWLGYAASRSQIKAVQALLEAGVDPGQADQKGNTPLHHLVRWGAASEVHQLLERGVNPNVQGGYDHSTPLHRARSAAIIEDLLRHGANPNLVNHDGETPLLSLLRDCFRERGYVQCDRPLDAVESLLKHGADATLRGSLHVDGSGPVGGRTPLEFAKEAGLSDLVRVLQKYEK